MKKNKLAIITGATAGIGQATAELLAHKGYNLILTGRREDRLRVLSKKLKTKSNQITPLSFDISKASEVKKAFEKIEQHLPKVEVLINNAGLAVGTDLIQVANIEDWDQMIDTNIKGLLCVTRSILPFMVKRDRGHIINLGSTAGRWTYKGGAVYCATKFAVRAFSEGLRMDLIGTSIRVTNIEPGMVETEFSEVRLKDKAAAKAVYSDMKPLGPKDIAECIYWSLERPAHVNIQEMVIFPTDQAAVGQVHRHK